MKELELKHIIIDLLEVYITYIYICLCANLIANSCDPLQQGNFAVAILYIHMFKYISVFYFSSKRQPRNKKWARVKTIQKTKKQQQQKQKKVIAKFSACLLLKFKFHRLVAIVVVGFYGLYHKNRNVCELSMCACVCAVCKWARQNTLNCISKRAAGVCLCVRVCAHTYAPLTRWYASCCNYLSTHNAN